VSRSRCEVCDAWLDSGFARHTRANYGSDIRRFFAWADTVGTDVFAVSSVDLEAYRGYLTDRRLAPASVARGLVAVRSFLAFASDTRPSVGADRGGAGRGQLGDQFVVLRPHRAGP
jgi:site-specific recombinase XerD